ncbi:alpha-(1,3)-fucosyltransferase C-like isoform X2 [Epargyreus clarus]|uniref:alpha-(1,3)-fucosyltransferase C-like isoform X2 n=1 Tax=Epargyreus clarus TaxID=520877 RepID=UPI003C2CF544
MPRCIPFPKRLPQTLRQMISVRLFFIVTCISFVISIIWIQYVNVYRKSDRLPEEIKYMLLWTRQDYAPFYFLGTGQRGFIEQNCSAINCYVTDNRHFFGYGNMSKFDAVAFNGRNMKNLIRPQLPQLRYPHQKYIFFNMESADNYPVCDEIFDDFFNWTATYRLDSDILFPYILIRNSDGEAVGPKVDMEWEEDFGEIDEDLAYRLQGKSKAAAWFVSHCSSRSGRQELVNKLQNSLAKYGMTVDIYGSCGPLKCPIDKKASCDAILERDYYFYLSFENSFAEDYVTEKLLTALQHEAVPIVFGGANYSRFLPPGSYLDAKKLSPDDLAATMVALMKSPKDYLQYFRWKNRYTYHDPSRLENVCAVCEALSDVKLVEKTTRYKKFREWWHPKYKERCNS